MSATKDDWDEISQHYHDHVARFTSRFAVDLMLGPLSKNRIQTCKTILDVGCGPGVFALEYLNLFPDGIDGQAIICSDLSPGMVTKAQHEITARLPSNYKTTFLFQVEDGSVLSSIHDQSIDLVVSVFGIFLIPDRAKCLAAIQRVLVPGGTLGTTAWTCLQGDSALEPMFGANLQHVLEQTTAELTSFFNAAAPWKDWGRDDQVNEFLASNEFANVSICKSIHTAVWSTVNDLWNLIASNPLANVKNVDTETADRAKQKLGELVLANRSDSSDRPVFVWMAANMITATKQ